jgi:RNA polymerase sigma factor (sigma-70 family)
MPVCVIDDDPSICRSLERVLRSAEIEVRTFVSPAEFMGTLKADETECVVLDLSLPERSGLDMQEELAPHGIPIVFISGYADVSTAVRAMKAGAIDFLAKPFSADAVLDAVHRGLRQRRERDHDQVLLKSFATLTPREREVLFMVADGMLNKQIGYELGIAEKTVKVHRARVLEKLGAASLADLVRMADRLRGG